MKGKVNEGVLYTVALPSQFEIIGTKIFVSIMFSI